MVVCMYSITGYKPISSPDPTLEEGKGSGELRPKAWSCAEKFSHANQITALVQSHD